MNRLVLIGNGFDLAHKLNTKYEHFIDWYWEDWGRRLLRGQGKKESDGLCSFTLKDNLNLNSWSYVWGRRYKREYPFEPWNPNDVIEIAKEDKDLCEFKYIGSFLQNINKSIETKKWVDIENEYYSLLFQQKMTLNGDIMMPDYRAINLQLDILQIKLINYLGLESKKETPIIKEIKDKIYCPIKEREISVSYKGSVDKGLLKKKEPSAIMLLNFNYTKTPEQYVTNPSTTKINYIHGKLDDPKSVIFGYGDDANSRFRMLSNVDEKECLRHIKSIRYLESDNYRRLMEFIESESFQIIIMGHSCGNSDGTLLNTLFEHKNCISIKPYYYYNQEKKEDNYLELVQNISRNFTDMKLMRDRVVNKLYCEPITNRRNN